MFEYEFDNQSAQEAKSSAGWIKEGGPREVTIKKVKYAQGNEKSDYFEFDMEDNDGARAQCRMYLHKKNGEYGFQKPIVDALMGILGISKLTTDQTFEGEYVPQFVDKKVICKFQEEEFYRKDGTIGTKVNIVNFYDPHTRKSYTEKLNNLPALDIEVPTYLRKAKPGDAPAQAAPSPAFTADGTQVPAGAPSLDDDLPF